MHKYGIRVVVCLLIPGLIVNSGTAGAIAASRSWTTTPAAAAAAASFTQEALLSPFLSAVKAMLSPDAKFSEDRLFASGFWGARLPHPIGGGNSRHGAEFTDYRARGIEKWKERLQALFSVGTPGGHLPLTQRQVQQLIGQLDDLAQLPKVLQILNESPLSPEGLQEELETAPYARLMTDPRLEMPERLQVFAATRRMFQAASATALSERNAHLLATYVPNMISLAIDDASNSVVTQLQLMTRELASEGLPSEMRSWIPRFIRLEILRLTRLLKEGAASDTSPETTQERTQTLERAKDLLRPGPLQIVFTLHKAAPDEGERRLLHDILTLENIPENLEMIAERLSNFNALESIAFLQSLAWVADWPEVSQFILHAFTDTSPPSRKIRSILSRAASEDSSSQGIFALIAVFTALPSRDALAIVELADAEAMHSADADTIEAAASEGMVQAMVREKMDLSSTYSDYERHRRASEMYEAIAEARKTNNDSLLHDIASMYNLLAAMEIHMAIEVKGRPDKASEKIVTEHYLVMTRDLEQALALKSTIPIKYFWYLEWLIRLEETYVEWLHVGRDAAAKIFERKLTEHQEQREKIKRDQQKILGLETADGDIDSLALDMTWLRRLVNRMLPNRPRHAPDPRATVIVSLLEVLGIGITMAQWPGNAAELVLLMSVSHWRYRSPFQAVAAFWVYGVAQFFQAGHGSFALHFAIAAAAQLAVNYVLDYARVKGWLRRPIGPWSLTPPAKWAAAAAAYGFLSGWGTAGQIGIAAALAYALLWIRFPAAIQSPQKLLSAA